MAAGIGTTGQTGAAAAAGSGASSRTTIAQNFDSFLLLLTTQLKNQSPLDPLDTNQFTQQLVQFASVEQQLKSNDTLSALLASTRASTTSTAASFVGLTVTADSSTARYADGKATWSLNAARDASRATVAIRDKSGTEVAQKTINLKAGAQTFSWDGITPKGQVPDGDYAITVTAVDAAGRAIEVKTEVSGKVDSVDLSDSTPVLVIGGSRVPLSSVKSIARLAN